MPTRRSATILGALTGLLTLVAMVRLITDGFSGGMSRLAWSSVLVALVPWTVYATWRARRGRLSGRAALTVLALDVAGLVLVWVSTLGTVLALACALSAVVVIWLSDLPTREPRGEDRFVRIEDLQSDEPDESS